jgi:hypothetical protein
MKSFAAFSRRLMLSLLIAFWTTSLIYATWRCIRDGANTSAVGFTDLYSPYLAQHYGTTLLVVMQITLCLGTIILAAWEVHSSRFRQGFEDPPQD